MPLLGCLTSSLPTIILIKNNASTPFSALWILSLQGLNTQAQGSRERYFHKFFSLMFPQTISILLCSRHWLLFYSVCKNKGTFSFWSDFPVNSCQVSPRVIPRTSVHDECRNDRAVQPLGATSKSVYRWPSEKEVSSKIRAILNFLNSMYYWNCADSGCTIDLMLIML